MESSRDMNTVVGTGTSGNRSAARAKAANAPRCRQARAVRHRVGTFNVRNHRFTVDLSGARPRHLKSEFLSISKELLEGFAVRSIDRLYRHLMQITSFNEFMRVYFELVISTLWKELIAREIKLFYVLDNTLREDRFRLTCEAFSLSGIAVVTPYSRRPQDGSELILQLFDRQRMERRMKSAVFEITNIIIPMGYCPQGHHLESAEVNGLIRYFMKIGKMVAYIEKDSSVNYLETVLGKFPEYVQVFRNKGFQDGEFRVSGNHIKGKEVVIVLDTKAP